MQEVLMDCHEREILKLCPRSTYYSRYCKGLLTRNLIEVKPFNRDGKSFMGFFITDAGITYLKHMSQS